MNYRMQQQANRRDVITCFDRVAKLDYVKDKWISLDLIRRARQFQAMCQLRGIFLENFSGISLVRLNHERS